MPGFFTQKIHSIPWQLYDSSNSKLFFSSDHIPMEPTMRLLALTSLTCLVACLAGCGGSDDASAVANQSELEAYVDENAEAVANLEAFEAEMEGEEDEDE